MYIVIVASSRRSFPFHIHIYIYTTHTWFSVGFSRSNPQKVKYVTYGCFHDNQRSTGLSRSATVTSGYGVLSDYQLHEFMAYHYKPFVNSNHFSDVCCLRFTDHVYIRHSSPLSSLFRINTKGTLESVNQSNEFEVGILTKAKVSTLPPSMIRYAHSPFTISVIKVLGLGTGSFEGSRSITRRSRLVSLAGWDLGIVSEGTAC